MRTCPIIDLIQAKALEPLMQSPRPDSCCWVLQVGKGSYLRALLNAHAPATMFELPVGVAVQGGWVGG